MLLSFHEIFDFLLIWLATGVIFMPLNMDRDFMIKFILLVGLSTVLHEFFHKLAAVLLGVNATFHAFYIGLIIGLLLKFIFPNFIFFIPGYVNIYSADPLVNLLTAFAGPFANFLLFVVFKYLALEKNDLFYYELAKLNLWLFIFNMLPIPPLDGYKVITAFLQLV